MKIVILGSNETACLLAAKLYEEHDIVIIDNAPCANDALQKLDLQYLQGAGTNIAVLEAAGIKDADIFAACTDNDEANIAACLTVICMAELKTVCFVSRQENAASLELMRNSKYRHDLMIDYVIQPKELMTQKIFRIITVPAAAGVENFAGGRARLLEYRIDENTKFISKKIKDCNFPEDTLITGITRNDDLFIPDGNTQFQLNDKVIFMGSSYSLDILAGRFFQDASAVKSVIIVGGGSAGLMLAQNLEKMNIKVKIIEKDYERCEELTENLKKTLVINGSGADFALLQEEQAEETDVLVSVTNSDEKNLLCSMLAKQLGVPKVITRVSNNANAALFEKAGIDAAISQDAAAIDEIENHLIRTDVEILAKVERGQGEVLEITIPRDFKTEMIMNLKMPYKAVIAIIKRRNRVIIPRGKTQIMPFDNIIVFTKHENADAVLDYFK